MKKKLIVKQVDEYDCGACCLLSIIRYYNGNVPLELLKIDTNTSQFGTNAFELINASKKYGLEGKGINTKDLDNIKLPAIAHLKLDKDFYHFVVIYKIDKEFITIMDPALGKQKIIKEKFLNLFTGNLILLAKVTEITYLKSNSTLLKLIKLFLKTNKKDIIKIYILEFILIFLSIVNSFNLQLISSNLMLFTAIFLFYIFVKIPLVLQKNKILTNIKNILNLSLTKDFFSHLLSLPLKYIQLKSSGEILTRLEEMNFIGNFIINVLFKNIIEIIICIIIFIIILLFEPKLIVIIFLSMLLIIIISIVFSRVINPKIIREINNEGEYNSITNELVNSLETIKTLNNYSYFFKKFTNNLKNKVKHTINLEKMLLSEEIIFDFMSSFVYLFLIFYSLYKNINILNLITILNLSSMLFSTLNSFLNDAKSYNYLKNTFIKINEFFDVEKEELLEYNLEFSNDIEFKNVKFSYNNIKDLTYDFKIKENSFVMIKGQNGSGKSTICKLLTKILTDYQGEILIGGKNIKDYSSSEIRKIVAYSNQFTKLFKDTIKNNIILDNDISDEKFSSIAKICDLESVLKNKESRYNTYIYENSPNLSGGEVQKIILARTLLQDKRIIILDETLSAVNHSDEIAIINNMKKYLKDKTIIYITHKDLDMYFNDVIELERSELNGRDKK